MIINRHEVIAVYDQDQRIDIEYPTMRRQVTGKVVRQVNTRRGGEGAVIYSWLDERDVDEAIREQVVYFESIGQGFEWKVYDYDTPPDLKDRLAAYGFEVEDPDAIMILDLERAPEALFQPVTNPGFVMRRITEPDEVKDVLAIEQVVWGEDLSDLGRFLALTLADHPRWVSVYVAYLAGVPVSAGWALFPKDSQFASLWGGSTLSEYRGRGLYTALLAIRAQEAWDRGKRYLTVDASPMSRPILEKFGFEMIAQAYACKWKVR